MTGDAAPRARWRELWENLDVDPAIKEFIVDMSIDFTIENEPNHWSYPTDPIEDARLVLQSCWELAFCAGYKNRSKEWLAGLLRRWTLEEHAALDSAAVDIDNFIDNGYRWGAFLHDLHSESSGLTLTEALDVLWKNFNERA